MKNWLLLLSLLLVLTGCGRQEPQRSLGARSNEGASSPQSVPAQTASGEVRVSPSEAQMGMPVEVALKLKAVAAKSFPMLTSRLCSLWKWET